MKILFEPTDRASWGKKLYRQYLLNLSLSRLAYPVSAKLEVSVRYVVKLSERSLLGVSECSLSQHVMSDWSVSQDVRVRTLTLQLLCTSCIESAGICIGLRLPATASSEIF